MVPTRVLTPDDAPGYFELRLSALRDHPEAFGSSAEDWRDRPLREVEERLRAEGEPPERFTVGAFDGPDLIASAGVYREAYRKLRHKGHVVGVYVREKWRGRGVAGRLLDHLIALCRAVPGLEQLQLLVVTDNEPATRLYLSRGFQIFGVEEQAMLVDGRYYDEAHMQLFLRREA